MSSIGFDLVWRDRGVSSGLRNLNQQVAESKVRFSELNSAVGEFGKNSASGVRLGQNLGAGIERGAAQVARGKFFSSASLNRSAASAGVTLGGSLAKGVAGSLIGTITGRAGSALGNMIYDKAQAKLSQTRLFSKFAGNATKAGETAGANIGQAITRSAPAKTRWSALKTAGLVTAAVGAGVVFGRQFGQSATGAAGSAFKMDTSGLGKGLGAGLGGLKAGIAGLAVSLTGGAVFSGLKGLASAASDLNETTSKSRTIFGSSSKAIESWASGAARNLGMSRQQALDGASAFGNLFDQLGFGVGQSAKMSTGFAQMATDAASFNNANPADVMDAFLSATRGEYDALQKYIPTASAATIEAEAMRMTHKRSVGDLTAADKAAALYKVSVDGLGSAHGDFARTSGGFANQQRIMAANWADLRVKIGNYFLPMFTKAAKYMNEEGFPALTRIVGALGSIGGSAGRMGKAVLSAFSGEFASAIDGATLNLSEIADWLDTHQEKMVGFFLSLGHGAINFGRTLTALAASGLRSFGSMASGLASFVDGAIPGIQYVMEGIANVVQVFDKKAAASIRDASNKLGEGGRNAAAGLRATQTKAEQAASVVEGRMNPVFDAAEAKLNAVGNAEIWQARQRDAAARASIAIRDIGTKADGSQIKLKTWNDRTRLGAEAQRGLEGRINAARQRMLEQREAGIKAGDSQKELTKRWDQGKDALYREFRQMGLSKDEAKRLADRYARIPKKSETKVSQPGMSGAIGSVRSLKDRINEIPNSKKVAITFSAKTFAGADGVKYSVNTTAPSSVGRSADGGKVRGPGTGRSDSIMGVDEYDMPTTRVSAGEWVVNAKSSKKHDALLRAINHDGLATGGIVLNTAQVPKSAMSQPGEMRKMIRGYEQGIGSAFAKVVSDGLGAAPGSWGGGSFGSLDASQMGIASTIAAVGRGMGKTAQLIGIITGLVESGLRNVNFGDRDSLGVFQQRAPWGPASARRNVQASAGMFFHGGRGGQPGLDDIGGWSSMSPGRAAQRVQVSAFPSRYGARVSQGLKILTALGGQAGAASVGSPSGAARRNPGAVVYEDGSVGGNISNPTGLTTWRGGTFSNLFATRLRQAEAIAGQAIRVTQGGYRPTTSYSGTSHRRDAVDTQPSGAVIRALRAVGVASGDRTGLGNWGPHAHSVPTPGSGYAGGSAVWQAQDYLRRGGASQSLRSPWGLAAGGTMREDGVVRVAERGPERVLSTQQTQSYDRLVSMVSQRGVGGTTYAITIQAPNYVGSKQELRQTLLAMARNGDMTVVVQKAMAAR